METISLILSIIAIVGVFYFFKFYFPSYFQEKGKNLAQKEDIAAITDEVEKVRAEYALQVEKVKSDLSKTIYVHKLQFEAEFQALKSIWEKLLALRNNTLALRPMLGKVAKSEDQGKRIKQERFEKFANAFDEFAALAERDKPFYPQSIWNELDGLL